MLLGGPFSFLAGLFCLGASGVMKVAEDAQVRERYREFESHKYPPYGFQNDLLISARFGKNYYGLDNNKIESYLHAKYDVDFIDASKIRAIAIVKDFVQKIGYEFNPDPLDCDYHKFIRYAERKLVSKEFRIKEYDDIVACNTLEDVLKLRIRDYEALELFDSLQDPYRQVLRYKKMGFFQDVKVTDREYWKPEKGDRKIDE